MLERNVAAPIAFSDTNAIKVTPCGLITLPLPRDRRAAGRPDASAAIDLYVVNVEKTIAVLSDGDVAQPPPRISRQQAHPHQTSIANPGGILHPAEMSQHLVGSSA